MTAPVKFGQEGFYDTRSISLSKGAGVFLAGLKVDGDSIAHGDTVGDPNFQWPTILSGDNGATLNNTSSPGTSIFSCATRIANDPDHRNWVTVIMDHRSHGETTAEYLGQQAAILALQPFTIFWPQCGVTDGSLSPADLQVLAEINAGDAAQFPNNSFTSDEIAEIVAAFSDPTTRTDNLHFNEKGQALQTFFLSAWLVRRGWRVERPETTALISRMPVAPVVKRRAYYNALIERQVGAAVWPSHDGFYVTAAHDVSAARLNWISANYPLVQAGGVTFVVDRGFTGNGVDGKMRTGFDPAAAPSPKFVQNSARLVVYPITDVAESRNDAGSTTSTSGMTFINTRNADNSQSYRVNSAATASRAAGGANKSLFAASRIDAANIKMQVGGMNASTTANASTTPAGGELSFCGAMSYGTKQIAMGSIGADMTTAQLAHDYNSRTAYLKAIGAL